MFEVSAKRTESPVPKIEPAKAAPKPNDLDSEELSRLHGALLDYYARELDRQNENRLEQAVDEDFYDSIQWRAEDAKVLKERGQAPIVYNVIASTVDWVLGTEKRGRSDFKVLPRRKEDGKPAEKKTALLKYLSDVNRTPFHRSRSFEDSVKVGIGWLEDGIQDADDEEPISSRYESWRNMLWDTAATELDLSDARYLFRSKWVDLDISEALFPKRYEVLRRSLSDSDSTYFIGQYGDEAMDSAEYANETSGGLRPASYAQNHRQRVRIIEGWVRRPVMASRLKGGQFSGDLFDPSSPGHVEQVNSGQAQLVEKVTMLMHVALFTSAGLLWFSPTPYRHNRFPFTPIWAYRRGRDGMPYGMIRRLRDIQEDINKRASKALAILSSNKVIMDEGAVDDLDEFEEEVAKPNAIIVKKADKELKIDVDRDLSQWHLELMSRSIQMIQQQSGVTDELLGRTTNAQSGIAVQRRQEQGSLTTTKLFDNLRLASQVQGEKQLSLVEQFMSEEKQFRITNMRGGPEFVTVNDGLPENDIVRTKADYVISDADWRATMRQAAADQLMEMLTKLPPEVAMTMLDLVVENMDLPNRDEIVKRIRSITGQRDPDADEPTQEEMVQAEQAQKAQAVQEQALQLQLRGQAAQIAKTEADTAKIGAQIADLQSKLAGTNVATQRAAIDTAQTAAVAPMLAPVADQILNEAGFVSAPEQQQRALEQSAMQEAMARQQVAQQEQQAAQQPQEPPAQMAPQPQPGA
ncbi:portal protein [Xanthobacter dioxanivorans]|uniref:portal protein n=1 Tax=Xanthobacter dioxanivorans TaxID=2528964 RepID=UPI001932AB24|nr:hypothetical protein [Xanthobacter dioxanivorans]